MDGGVFFLGDFSRWLTHAHLFSSCYQSLFHSKAIRTYDPSRSSADSRAAAVQTCIVSPEPDFILSRENKDLV